jgi:hypothetical protein
MCRRAGWLLAGETTVQVRPGLSMQANDWTAPQPSDAVLT